MTTGCAICDVPGMSRARGPVPCATFLAALGLVLRQRCQCGVVAGVHRCAHPHALPTTGCEGFVSTTTRDTRKEGAYGDQSSPTS